MSRLSDQTKVLAQRHALLEERLREVENSKAREDREEYAERLR
jgi:hypothetical protein